jgi:predicted secreted hydrolase
LNPTRQVKLIVTMIQKFTLLLIFLFAVKASTQDWKTYPFQQPGSLLSFPADEGFHFKQDIEWIYFSGHVTGKSTGNDYSFVLAYFYYPAFGYDGFRIFNISNETSKQFYDETLPCIYESLAEDSLNIIANAGFTSVHTEEWTTLTDSAGKMRPFRYHINAMSQTGSIDIDCNTLKRPLIVADSGFLYQGAAGYTYYYSQTMIDISGTISLVAVEDSIFGKGWIDHQFGNFNPNNSEDYEWFCIQLDNGMDLNIWNIFTENNTIPETSAYRICSVYINDSSSFTTSDFNLERLKFAYTTDGEKCYSQKWHMTSDTFDIDLLVTTQNSNSEVALPFRFFEGSTLISGAVEDQQVEGKGFAELLHSYEKPDISIVYPYSAGLWDDSESARWILGNPDDGNTILYDMEISYGRTGAFKKIVRGIKDKGYYWNPSYFTSDTIVSLRITGYSADSTLSDAVQVTAGINSQNIYNTLCQGDNLSYFISLRAGEEYDYQWQKDGENITGATDSLHILDNLQQEDHGTYRCILSGGCYTDTTILYILNIEPVYESAIAVTICNNDSVLAGGKWQNSPGIYYDTLNSSYGCDSIISTSLHVDICTLNTDESLAQNFRVSPNPAEKSLSIEFDRNFTGTMEIMDCYGRVLKAESIRDSNKAEMDLSGLTGGIYMLRLNSKEYQAAQKIIVVN